MLHLVLLVVRWHCSLRFVDFRAKEEVGVERYRGRRFASRDRVAERVADLVGVRIHCAKAEVLLEERTHCGLEEDLLVRRRFPGFDGKEEGQLAVSIRCCSEVAF